MIFAVEIAESAERDITEIADVIAFAYGDPIGAQRVTGRIFAEIESLAEMPMRYPLAENSMLAALQCRQFAVGNFNIIYQIDETKKQVCVVAVAYNRRLPHFVLQRLT